MKDIIAALEEKRSAKGEPTMGKYVAVASLAFLVAACSPSPAAQAEVAPWISAGNRFQIEFASNGWRVVPPPYPAPGIVLQAENQSGTAGCELSVVLQNGPPGSQQEVNGAIRSVSENMRALESSNARNYRLTTREVSAVALLESSGQYGNAENTVTRFGLYHDGALHMYTLACGAAADDAAGVAEIRTVAGSLRFLQTDDQ